ncbi:DUF559 domain-containing protein [Microlunatus parietis]|uniref:DUF559 domain-containing protein n=1 Tax=Microlunatus parietis TaxID=682979 RepID=UPI0015CC8A9C|nr:DUF559 domain-containing protein [Microlunatus parietis]
MTTARRERERGRRNRVRSLRRLVRGVYLEKDDEPTLLERCAAAVLAAPPDTVVVGVTALWLHGVEVADPLPVRLATATDLRRRTPGLRLVRRHLLPLARNRVALPVPAWVEACTELSIVDAVAVADRLIKLGRATRKELVEAAAAATGRGCRTARRAAELARPNVASVRESELRLMLIMAGLPEPRCNVAVGDEQRRIAEVDLYYDEFRVVVEYEGEQHRTDGWQWSADIERYEALAAAGYAVIRVTAARLRQARALVTTIHDHLTERGYRGRPPRFGTEWRSLFEA